MQEKSNNSKMQMARPACFQIPNEVQEKPNFVSSGSAMPNTHADSKLQATEATQQQKNAVENIYENQDGLSSEDLRANNELNQVGSGMVQAKEISFFNKSQAANAELAMENDDGSPGMQFSEHARVANHQLEAFTLDDDIKSLEEDGAGMDEQEVEERAVVDFVSEMELDHGSIKLRGDIDEDYDEAEGKKEDYEREKEDEDLSQQFSLDDVTDDEDGEQDIRQEETALNTEIKRDGEESSKLVYGGKQQEQESINQASGKEYAQNLDKRDSVTNKVQQSSTNDSTTNRDSSSSNNQSKEGVTAKANDMLQGEKTKEKTVADLKLSCGDQGTITAVEKQLADQIADKIPSPPPETPVSQNRQSNKKIEPQLDKENYVKGHFQKFLAHVETRVINKGTNNWEQSPSKNHTERSKGSNKSSSSSKSDDSEANKDNEDPTATTALKADQFDPKEMRQEFDGWSLYKKMRISFAPVRRYQMMVDQDYKKNKVTVCAHLQNIFTTFCVRRGKATHQMNNFFDIDKWVNKMTGNSNSNQSGNSPTKELKRTNTIGNMNNADDQDRIKENYLLTKSNSTAHIPENIRAKNSKRAYANFDKDLAVKMFGYRVIFKKKKMEIKVPDPQASQVHKPLNRFANDIINELAQQYQQIPRFHTKQLILMPLPEGEDMLQEDVNSAQDGKNAENQNQFASTSDNPASETPEDSGVCTPNCDKVRGDSASKKIRQIRKYGGEIVNLRTKHGERQNFLKKTRNLIWHCAPIERLQSATSYQKRASYAKGASSTLYGQSSINQSSSPARTNSISPKKPLGWNQSNTKQTPQTHYNAIKMMSTVRYAVPKQGTLHPPGQNGSNSIRFQQSGACNQNFNNYRRQNSYRKGQRPMRVDSAKGYHQGMRQSMENNCNPAYRLINQQTMQSSSDQNFIMNGGNINTMQDSEVAQITAAADQQNVVHLKDPKLIEGFGSNVVHVNVSCGQTLPEQTQKAVQPQKAESRNPPPVEEDDDAQTFIIQLSEEQTRQLANGSLKLNGVPIPKDLSNLNYDQIMALLDSVNLPPQKGPPSKATTDMATSQGHASHMQGSPIGTKSQLQEQKFSSEARSKNYQQPFIQNNVKYNQTFSQSGKQAGTHYMGQTFSGTNNTSSAFQQMNVEMFRKQYTQYPHTNTSIMSQIEQHNQMGIKHPGIVCKPEPPPNIKTVKPGRELVRQSQGRQSTRLESATRRNRQQTRHQASSYGSTKNESDLKMQINGTQQQRSQQRQQRGPQNHQKMQKQGQTVAGAMAMSQGRNGTSAKVATGNMMGGSEWDMLTMLTQQQQHLKNAQQFLQQTNMNLEHARKMQAMGQQNTGDSSMVSDGYAMNGNANHHLLAAQQNNNVPPNSVLSNNIKQDAFNRATIGQIQANSLMYHNNGGSALNGQNYNIDSTQPVAARQASVSASHHPANTSSQQMISTISSAGGGNPAGFNYIRMVHPNQGAQTVANVAASVQSATSHQKPNNQGGKQKSMTRLSSKKRISDGRDPQNLQHSSSRGFLKNPNQAATLSLNQQQSARIPNHPHLQSAQHQNLIMNQMAASAPHQQKQMIPGNAAKQVNNNIQVQDKHSKVPSFSAKIQNQQHYIQYQESGQRSSKEGTSAINRYYKSVNGQGSLASGTQSNMNNYSSMATVQKKQSSGAATTQASDQVKSLSTKNQISKTSIELEYSKFESSSNGNGKQGATKVGPAGAHLGSKMLQNMQPQPGMPQNQVAGGQNRKTMGHQHAQNAPSGSQQQQQQYYQRIGGDAADASASQPLQKLRINQHTLNSNNLNYNNQSSTHKRKIDSALAQSAINAIQSQNPHVGLQIGSNSNSIQAAAGGVGGKNAAKTLHFEQKALSQKPAPQHHHQHAAGKVGKPNDYRGQGNTTQPPFIMRNPQQILNSSEQQQYSADLGIQSDYQAGPSNKKSKNPLSQNVHHISQITSANNDISPKLYS